MNSENTAICNHVLTGASDVLLTLLSFAQRKQKATKRRFKQTFDFSVLVSSFEDENSGNKAQSENCEETWDFPQSQPAGPGPAHRLNVSYEDQRFDFTSFCRNHQSKRLTEKRSEYCLTLINQGIKASVSNCQTGKYF